MRNEPLTSRKARTDARDLKWREFTSYLRKIGQMDKGSTDYADYTDYR
jgi:hypothetical protein